MNKKSDEIAVYKLQNEKALDLLESDDSGKRLQGEWFLATLCHTKLKKQLLKYDAALWTSKPTPEFACPIDLIREQKHALEEYMKVLELRMEMEGVNSGCYYLVNPDCLKGTDTNTL